MPLLRTRLLVAGVAIVLTGCSGSTSESSSPVSRSTTSSPSPEPTQPSTVTTNTPPETTGNATSSTVRSSRCSRLADFESTAENDRWETVNDNVMGGRSEGGPSFESGQLVFAGTINTNGGGFSSLRLNLKPDQLVGYERVVFRARTDGRPYMVTFDDNVSSRDRRVSHRAEIPFTNDGVWQTASVPFDDLFPAIFGRRIDDTPFRPELATRMGVMISDPVDGPFRIEIDWIEACAGEGAP